MKSLYKVTIKKLVDFYVVTTDPTTAYKIVRDVLNKNDWYFSKDRELYRIELLANENHYGDLDILICT